MGKNSDLGKRRILKELYYEEGLSCAALASKIGRSFPVTQKLIEELVTKEVLIESGFAPSTGGRRPQIYSLQNDVSYLVAVAMDQFVTKIAIMDMQNNFVGPVSKIVLPLQNNQKAISILTDELNRVIQLSGIDKSKFLGAGIGMPGLVNVQKGFNYSYLQEGSKSLTKQISEKTGIPVVIYNDSSDIALAELKFGAAKNEKNALVINIGWGIGLGLILNGELFRGEEGFAGEFSHIPLFLNGKLCTCGKTGCLQTEASLSVVLEKAAEGLRAGRVTHLGNIMNEDPEIACDELINAAVAGDQFAVELFSEAGFNIGKGLAVLIHILNPRKIILSGRGALAGRIWEAPIRDALNKHCIPRLFKNTELEVSKIGHNAELIGAGALVMEYLGRVNEVNSKQTVVPV